MPSGKPPPIRTFIVTENTGVDTTASVRKLFEVAGHPLTGCRVDKVVRIQGEFDFETIRPLLTNPQAGQAVEEVTGWPLDSQLQDADGSRSTGTVEIAYRPSVTDPETDSGLLATRCLGAKGVEWLRVSTLYRLSGDSIDNLAARAVLTSDKAFFNPVVHVVVEGSVYQDWLRPSGEPQPMRRYDFRPLTDDELLELSSKARWNAPLSQLVKLREYQNLKLKRPYTSAEVEGIFQWWCNHCFHTMWKGLGLWQAMKRALEEFGDPNYIHVLEGNAGSFLFYDGFVITIKGESHNHPSGIYTLGGIETMLGGLFRDPIFNQGGGEVIAATVVFGTRLPSGPQALGAIPSRVIAQQQIAGTRNYANPSGVPNAGFFHRADEGYVKPWCLGAAIGIQPLWSVTIQEPEEGDFIVVDGGKTGRDGVHGATGSSGELTADVVALEGAEVQIGTPITQRGLATFIPAARDAGHFRVITDCGAGGISCAVGELCADCGAEIDLTDLPVKDTSLGPDERWISESQERGVIIVPPSELAANLALAELHGVNAFVLGRCRSDRRLIVRDHGEVVIDLDLGFVWGECPIDEPTVEEPQVTRQTRPVRPHPQNRLNANVLTDIVGCYDQSDQSLAGIQYDKTVGGRTFQGPLLANDVPSDASIYAPIYGKPYGAVLTCAYVPRWNRADPVRSVGCIMALAISRTIAAGVSPDDHCLCDNFYNPAQTAEQRWYLQQQGLEMLRLGKAWKLPISGKESSAGTYTDPNGRKYHVPHTFVAHQLGKMPDVKWAKTKVFTRPGDAIFLVRPPCQPNLAGSVALEYLSQPDVYGDLALPWPEDEDEFLRIWQAIHATYSSYSSLAAVGEGGAFLQVFHGSLASGLGADLDFSNTDNEPVWDLLGECPGSFVITAPASAMAESNPLWSYAMNIGRVVSRPGIQINTDLACLLSPNDWPNLVQSWQTGFAKEVYPQ